MINATKLATIHDVDVLKAQSGEVVLVDRYMRTEVSLTPDEARALAAAINDGAGPAPEPKRGAKK